MTRPFFARFAWVPVLLAAFSGPAAADTWRFDKDHTEVRFTWDHLGLSRQGGRFGSIDGVLNFDPAYPAASSVEAKLAVKSLMTGVKALDDLLVRSGEYFLASQSPDITFKSTALRMTGERTAEIDGDLTINGTTKPVVLEARWNFTGPHPLAAINAVYANHVTSGFSASTQILRSEWGLTKALPFVSDEIRISIETELHREGPGAPAAPPGAPPGPEAGSGRMPVPEPPAGGAAGDPLLTAPAPATRIEQGAEGHPIISDPDVKPLENDEGGEDLPPAYQPLNRGRP